jgi:diguanylate cyclase (GGDEF)-like protein
VGGDPIRVLLVGTGGDLGSELDLEPGFETRWIPDLAALGPGSDDDAVVVSLEGPGPLEALEVLRLKTPAAAVLVLTPEGREADGAVALHAGAEDHLVRGSTPPGLLPRAIRYAVERRRLRRELATMDDLTRMPNLRCFTAIAEHQLRMADRTGTPTVLLFIRLDDHGELERTRGPAAANDLVREAGEVVLDAIRDADLPARIAPDTFCVLLSGEARGAESTVLSRLVEAIAERDAAGTEPSPLRVSVGTAIYDPARPTPLGALLRTAEERMRPSRPSGAEGQRI